MQNYWNRKQFLFRSSCSAYHICFYHKHDRDQLNFFYFTSWFAHIVWTFSTFGFPIGKRGLRRKETRFAYLSLPVFVIISIIGGESVHELCVSRKGYDGVHWLFVFLRMLLFLCLKQVLIPPENMASEGSRYPGLLNSRCYTHSFVLTLSLTECASWVCPPESCAMGHYKYRMAMGWWICI